MKSEDAVLVADYPSRIIWLDGGITPNIAYKFRRILSKMNKVKGSVIILYIRGPGGDPYAAFTMMSDIQGSENPVATVAHGYVNSACFTITQSAAFRLALPKTTFTFHPAVSIFYRDKMRKEVEQMPQKELIQRLERLRLIDVTQLYWFTVKGRPVEEIFELFEDETTLGTGRAKKLKLINAIYKEEDFAKDKRRINKILKSRKKA